MEAQDVAKTLFDCDNSYALYNILVGFHAALYCNRKQEITEKLIHLILPNKPLPKFFQDLDKAIEEHKKETFIEKLVKSPKQLQKSPLTWVYYALFFALKLPNDSKKSFEENENIKAIFLLILKFHYYYILYQNQQSERRERSFSFYVSATITLVRMVEYLITFAQKDNAYINDLYFSDLSSLDTIFFKHTTEQGSLEKEYFFIKVDKKIGNYLVYQKSIQKIDLKINSSRMLRKGEQVGDFQYNQNITSYFKTSSSDYLQLMGLEIYSGDQKGGRGNPGERLNEIQDTEEENFFKFIKKQPLSISSDNTHEEALEAKSLQKNYLRVFPKNEQKQEIPNLYKQHLRNNAFSASFTKRSLLLSTSYDIPALPIFRDFLLFLSQKPFSSTLNIEDFYRTIFLLDAILGIGYLKIVGLLFEDNKSDIQLTNNYLSHKIDPKVVAKDSKNVYLQNTKKELIYRLPRGLIHLINKTKSYSRDLTESDKDKHYTNETAQQYFKFIKEQIKAFPKKIYFNPNQIWKILNVYRRTNLYEDMSTMFCMGKYLQNDTPTLAYASTNKRAQNHSLLLDKLYETLNMHICIAQLLNVPESFLATEIELSDSHHYTGSSRAVLPEKSRYFFDHIKRLYRAENDREKHFNLVAIYTRYALSLLLGTRNFKHSASLSRISFAMHTLIISEKAQTLLSGTRVIPLCTQAIEIISSYQSLCREYRIDANDIYLLSEQEQNPFSRDLACSLLEKYKIEDEIIHFVKLVPLNTGRHCITKLAMETNFNLYYLKTFMGHYIAGGEQLGVFSTLDMQDYIAKTKELTTSIAIVYGV